MIRGRPPQGGLFLFELAIKFLPRLLDWFKLIGKKRFVSPCLKFFFYQFLSFRLELFDFFIQRGYLFYKPFTGMPSVGIKNLKFMDFGMKVEAVGFSATREFVVPIEPNLTEPTETDSFVEVAN